MRQLFALLLPVLVLSACASGPLWTKPGATQFETEQAERQCRREADAVIAQQGGYRYYEDTGPGAADDPMAQVDQSRLSRQLNALIAACMRDKGYLKAR